MKTLSKEEILNTRETVMGLCGLARKLGYKDPFSQLINNDGTCIGDLLDFFEDNPGAICAVVEWVHENYGDDKMDEDEEVDEDEDDEG